MSHGYDTTKHRISQFFMQDLNLKTSVCSPVLIIITHFNHSPLLNHGSMTGEYGLYTSPCTRIMNYKAKTGGVISVLCHLNVTFCL